MEQRKLGKYDIRTTIGRGAMGVVYQGWDPVIARPVAIKTVRLPHDADAEAADMLARCKREAQAAGRLNHPNIVGVFDYGETDEVAFIVMEFIDGRTLKTVLDRGERLPPAEILRIMTALLAGLQYSHDKGVVHRDIKPANLMLAEHGQVKIADFGIARIESSNMTQVGAIMGTPAYMSPEQFMGHTVDRRTDIYSAGVLLYQLVTGERPFEGSISGIMHKALHTEPPRPSDRSVIAPAALDAVVAKAMAKRPEDRFDSADAFSRALRDAFEHAAAADETEATIVSVRARTPGGDTQAAGTHGTGKLAPGKIAPGALATGTVAPGTIATGTSGTAVGVVPRQSGKLIIAMACLLCLAAAGAGAWYWTGRHAEQQLAEQQLAEPHTAPEAAAPTAATPGTGPSAPPQAAVGTPPGEVSQPPAEPAEAPATTQSATTQPAAPPAPPIPAPSLSRPSTTTTMAEPAPNPVMPPGLIPLGDAQALAAGIPCSLINVSETTSANIKSRLHVSGPMLPGAAFDAFLGRLRGPDRLLDVTTDRIEPGECAALDAVADRVRHSRDGIPLHVVAPEAPVEAGGRLTVSVDAVSEGAIYLDLFAADGSVHHLVRRTVPSGGGGDMHLTAAAPNPPGQRLLVAIATSAPLNLMQRPVNENAEVYLAALQNELARGSADGPEPRVEIAIVSVVAPVRPPPPASGAASARLQLPGLNAGH